MNLEPHPEPPVNLFERSLPLVEFAGPWFRIHQSKYDPLYFGYAGENRFTAPVREYGILYVAHDEYGAFIETFGQSTGINTVTSSALNQRSISRIHSERSLRLVDLTGPGLAQLGADARLSTEVPHNVARRWARALWQHPDLPDGICYRARHDPSRLCSALYNRAESDVRAVLIANLLSPIFAEKLAEILDTYQFGLV